MLFRPYKELFAIPLRNGLTKPKAVRGIGVKMVNMGELFANPRIVNVEMDRVQLSQTERDSSLLASGDLLFARQSLVLSGAGKCSIFVCDKEDACFESHVIRCRLNQQLADPYYYYYYFSSSAGRKLIETIVEQGAGASGIRGSDLADLSVPWIDPIIQRRIAGILCRIDEKIEINCRINQTLEAMAHALFKSWFVDFDPVKAKIAAKQEGRNPLRAAMSVISGKSESEIDAMPRDQFDQLAETAALFPEEMEESELGQIPEGWEVETLSSLIDFNPRYTLKKGVVAPYLDMKNAPTQGHLADEVILREFGSGAKFSNGDTLLARITPCLENGKTAFVDFLRDGEVGWGSTEFIVMRPKESIPVSIGYLIARLDAFRSVAIQSMTGTSGRQRAEAETLAMSKWLRYPDPLLQELDRIAGKYLEMAKSYGQEMKCLATLRDTLLPKLLSGELTVNAVPVGVD